MTFSHLLSTQKPNTITLVLCCMPINYKEKSRDQLRIIKFTEIVEDTVSCVNTVHKTFRVG